MKSILTILAIFIIQISFSQDVELMVKNNRTYIRTAKSYKLTDKYSVSVHNRRIFVFNFVNKNYKVGIIGIKSKELKVYSDRTILKIKSIILPNKPFKLKLTEYKD